MILVQFLFRKLTSRKCFPFTLPACPPPDQRVQAVLQVAVLDGAPGVAGCRLRGQMHAAGAPHLPRAQLHPPHRLPVLPPAAARPLQAGPAVLRSASLASSAWL